MCITGKALILTIQARRPLGSYSSPQRPLSSSVVIITTSGGRPHPLHPSPSYTPHISPINTTDELFLDRVSTTWSILAVLSSPVLSCPFAISFVPASHQSALLRPDPNHSDHQNQRFITGTTEAIHTRNAHTETTHNQTHACHKENNPETGHNSTRAIYIHLYTHPTPNFLLPLISTIRINVLRCISTRSLSGHAPVPF
jgi:hypothetical protein